jgi:hypothetical protein
MYVLKFGDEYSAQRGGYTHSLRKAAWFATRADAQKAQCGLERVVEIVEREVDAPQAESPVIAALRADEQLAQAIDRDHFRHPVP